MESLMKRFERERESWRIGFMLSSVHSKCALIATFGFDLPFGWVV